MPSKSPALPQPAALVLISPWADLVDSISRVNATWEENEDFDFVLPDLAELFARYVLAAQKFGGIPDCDGDWQNLIAEMSFDELVEVASMPEVSPARAANFANLPPTFVTIGGCETLRDSQLELVAKLSRCGVAVEHEIFADMPHAVVLAN